jgi:hypothetical protein
VVSHSARGPVGVRRSGHRSIRRAGPKENSSVCASAVRFQWCRPRRRRSARGIVNTLEREKIRRSRTQSAARGLRTPTTEITATLYPRFHLPYTPKATYPIPTLYPASRKQTRPEHVIYYSMRRNKFFPASYSMPRWYAGWVRNSGLKLKCSLFQILSQFRIAHLLLTLVKHVIPYILPTLQRF